MKRICHASGCEGSTTKYGHYCPKHKVWGLLDQRWLTLVQRVKVHLEGVSIAWNRRAALEVVKLAGAVEPRAVVETVLAVYLMSDQAGHRFKSDRAFDTQLVRRLRALTELNIRVSASGNGKSNRVYSELPPRATAVIAQWINATLGVAGLWMAKGEREAEERSRRAKANLHDGLAEIDFD